jgi:hypothetical protein
MNKRSLNSNTEISNSKKVKKTPQIAQSNTLLNYFQSNKTDTVKSVASNVTTSIQNSILSYFKSEKSTQNIVKTEPIKTELETQKLDVKKNLAAFENDEGNILSNIDWNKFDSTKTENEEKFKEEENYDETDNIENSSSASTKTLRKCPFYKRIESISFLQFFFL